MEFVWNGKPVTLVGDSSLASQSLSLYRILALVQKADIAEFFAITHSSPAPRSELDSMFPGDLPILFTDLLKRFVAIFAQPTGLPPHRSVDHRIHLIEGSKPVNVRPYRYPQFQKVEMEKLVKEMLDQGIITPSHAGYVLNTVLAPLLGLPLNTQAASEAKKVLVSSLPTIENIWLKRDGQFLLGSFRPSIADLSLVWGLGKTAMLNHILTAEHGKRTENRFSENDIDGSLVAAKIVGAEDIMLLNNGCLHCTVLLQLLSDHQLFVKLSKCSFGLDEVEYLDHTVSGQGVTMDKHKPRTAIRDCPHFGPIFQACLTDEAPHLSYAVKDSLLCWNDRLAIPSKSSLIPQAEHYFLASRVANSITYSNSEWPTEDHIAQQYALWTLVSSPTFGIVSQLKKENASDPFLLEFHNQNLQGTLVAPYTIVNGLLLNAGRYVLTLYTLLVAIVVEDKVYVSVLRLITEIAMFSR
ncbi:hypothetical protein KIW84_023157 [Lathyrus oleraceus]|uniref:CobW/HypB/UreG nucleotide-binding domain-containing protein n=1 Tax=Pisum sativum TaxID=3888 RepID=A0A9D4YI49_PEA|nr:hypothetical protein KIW84_023153 [Pisum sativum]KAI5436921.1 hypothetical protein KIW84_023157 [Pisum sativum]